MLSTHLWETSEVDSSNSKPQGRNPLCHQPVIGICTGVHHSRVVGWALIVATILQAEEYYFEEFLFEIKLNILGPLLGKDHEFIKEDLSFKRKKQPFF